MLKLCLNGTSDAKCFVYLIEITTPKIIDQMQDVVLYDQKLKVTKIVGVTNFDFEWSLRYEKDVHKIGAMFTHYGPQIAIESCKLWQSVWGCCRSGSRNSGFFPSESEPKKFKVGLSTNQVIPTALYAVDCAARCGLSKITFKKDAKSMTKFMPTYWMGSTTIWRKCSSIKKMLGCTCTS